MLENIQIFIAVAENNSFSKAAKELRTSAATVTRKILQLEKQLGVTLLKRNTRRLALTEQGRYCYDQCKFIPNMLSELSANISNKTNEPKGNLNISVAVYSGFMELVPIIASFLKAYPKITIQFIKSNIYPDLIDDSYDIYFRYKEINTRTLRSIKLIDHELICCATPEYLESYGNPNTPQALKQHNCVIHQVNLYEGDRWSFTYANKTITISVNGNLKINNSALALEAALAGVGIVRLPRYFFKNAIDSGKLVEVLNKYTAPKLTAWLVVPRTMNLSRAHQVFIDYITDIYKKKVVLS